MPWDPTKTPEAIRQRMEIDLSNSPGYSGILDAYGTPVPNTQAMYLAWTGSAFTGVPAGYLPNPNYKPDSQAGTATTTQQVAPTAIPAQFMFTFDTVGQTIPRATGLVRLPLRTIWVQGVSASGGILNVASASFAAALCWPLNPDDISTILTITTGNIAFYDVNQGGFVVPDGLSQDLATALFNSLSAARIYPGDEAQLPDSLIVTDKGIENTPAFRNLHYIVFPNWPLAVTNGVPNNLTAIVSSPPPKKRRTPAQAAVEFAAGTG